MIYLTIISLLIIASYTVAVCVKQKGIPYSISATFYKLEHPYRFMAAMWLTAFSLMPAILEAGRENTEWAAFIALLGLLMVGAAPNFKDKQEGKVHITGAVLCLVFSQVWVAMNGAACLLVWFVWLIYTMAYMARHVSDSLVADFIRTRPMFWAELAALAAVYLTVFLAK